MEEEPTTTRLEGSDRRTRTAGYVAVLAIAFIALAIAKPWALGAPSRAPDGTAAAAPSSSVAPISPEPTIRIVADPNAMICLGPTGVELLSLVRWPGHEVRTWQVTTEAVGEDPRDPALVPVAILSSHVLGLGLCEEAEGATRSSTTAATILDIVSLVGAGRARTDLGSPVQITLDQASGSQAVLYGPPAGAAAFGPSDRADSRPVPSLTGGGSSSEPGPSARSELATDAPEAATWAVGTYALSFVFGTANTTPVRWLVFQIEAVPGEPG